MAGDPSEQRRGTKKYPFYYKNSLTLQSMKYMEAKTHSTDLPHLTQIQGRNNFCYIGHLHFHSKLITLHLITE